MKKYFVTGTGTEVGKTYVTASLCDQLLSQGKKVSIAKPIITGWRDDGQNDTEILLRAQGQPVNQKTIFTCSPWRFRHAMSPDMAARRDQRPIDFDEVVKFCLEYGENDDYVFIEGAGGIMTPIDNSKTMLDLAVRTRLPVLLVAGSYLGSMSHTLTALQALAAKKVTEVKVIINESEENPVPVRETFETIQRFCNAPVFLVPGKQRMPDLTQMVA